MNIQLDLRCRSRAYARFFLPALGLTWLASVAVCFGALFNYQTAPGHIGTVPVSLPADSQIEQASHQPTLIMFAHPRCPCTRASVGELARIMTSSQDCVRAYVVFHVPESATREWVATDLVAKALAIPGVFVKHDPGGIETRRFRIKTSGHVLLYDKAGRLSFSGGITSARGHAGDNEGSRKLIARIKANPSTERAEQIVFGCPILDEWK